MPHHNYVFHPQLKSKKLSYEIGPAIILPDLLVCNCGFASNSGNHLGKLINTQILFARECSEE